MTVETRSYQMKEIQGDMMTPISIYHSLHGKKKVLFESSAKHEESGRYSFIAVDPIGDLTGDQHGYSLSFENGKIEREYISVIEKLKKMMPVHHESYPFSFFGGAIGYFGYETAFYNEKIGELLTDELEMPDVHVMFYDTFIIFDHLKQTVSIAAIDLFQNGRSEDSKVEAIEKILSELEQGPINPERSEPSLSFKPQIQEKDFTNMVKIAKEHILQGDIFQVVLSQRFTSPFDGDPFSLYR